MAARLQRRGIHPGRGWERRGSGTLLEPEENIHDWIRGLLEPDERLVLPEDYVENWTMYDQVQGWGWFIRDIDAVDPDRIDFAWERDLKRMEKNGKDMTRIAIVDRVMIVRLRLPWSDVETEWLASEAEMEENGEDWEILEVYVRARRKDQPNSEPKLLLSPRDRRAYEAAPEMYEVTEKKYLAAYKMSPETRESLLR